MFKVEGVAGYMRSTERVFFLELLQYGYLLLCAPVSPNVGWQGATRLIDLYCTFSGVHRAQREQLLRQTQCLK